MRMADSTEETPTPSPLPLRGGGGRGLGDRVVGEGGEVEEAGDAGGVADELAGPVDDRVEVSPSSVGACWGEAGLDGLGESHEAVGGEVVEGEEERGGVRGEGRGVGDVVLEWHVGMRDARRVTKRVRVLRCAGA